MNALILSLLFFSAVMLSLGLIYIQIVGIYHSFKANIGYGLISIFLAPFALAVGAIKVFSGENILLRGKQ